jgi:diaminopimelate epimerase
VSRGLEFWKMTGAGNDFIVLDGRDARPGPLRDLATRLCPRRTAIGADGLMAVRPVTGRTIEVDYVNADGSTADFCGNGARCAARFAELLEMARSPLELKFPGRGVRAVVRHGEVEIETARPRLLGRLAWTLPGGPAIDAMRVDAGVEHAVIADGGHDLPLGELRAALDRQEPGVSRRVNITLVERDDKDRLRVRTHERGSGETLACGSGALAVVALEPGAERGVRRVVLPPAGIPLVVTLDADPGPARLAGEARLVYRGVIAPA